MGLKLISMKITVCLFNAFLLFLYVSCNKVETDRKNNTQPAKEEQSQIPLAHREMAEYWKIELDFYDNTIERKLSLANSYLQRGDKHKALKVLELCAENSLYDDLQIAAFYRDKLQMNDKAKKMLTRAEKVSFGALDLLKFAEYYKDSDPEKMKKYFKKASKLNYTREFSYGIFTPEFGKNKRPVFFPVKSIQNRTFEDIIEFCKNNIQEKSLVYSLGDTLSVNDEAFLKYQLEGDSKYLKKLFNRSTIDFKTCLAILKSLSQSGSPVLKQKTISLAKQKSRRFYDAKKLIDCLFEIKAEPQAIRTYLEECKYKIRDVYEAYDHYKLVKYLDGYENAWNASQNSNGDITSVIQELLSKNKPSEALAILKYKNSKIRNLLDAADYVLTELKKPELAKSFITVKVFKNLGYWDNYKYCLEAVKFCYNQLKDYELAQRLIDKAASSDHADYQVSFLYQLYFNDFQKAEKLLEKSLDNKHQQVFLINMLKLHFFMNADPDFCKSKIVEVHEKVNLDLLTDYLLFTMNTLQDRKLTERIISAVDLSKIRRNQLIDLAVFCLTRLKDEKLTKELIQSFVELNKDQYYFSSNLLIYFVDNAFHDEQFSREVKLKLIVNTRPSYVFSDESHLFTDKILLEKYAQKLDNNRPLYNSRFYFNIDREKSKYWNEEAKNKAGSRWNYDLALYNFKNFNDPDYGLDIIKSKLRQYHNPISTDYHEVVIFTYLVGDKKLSQKILMDYNEKSWRDDTGHIELLRFFKENDEPELFEIVKQKLLRTFQRPYLFKYYIQFFHYDLADRETALRMKNRMLAIAHYSDSFMEVAKYSYFDLGEMETIKFILNESFDKVNFSETSSRFNKIISIYELYDSFFYHNEIERRGIKWDKKKLFLEALKYAYDSIHFEQLSAIYKKLSNSDDEDVKFGAELDQQLRDLFNITDNYERIYDNAETFNNFLIFIEEAGKLLKPHLLKTAMRKALTKDAKQKVAALQKKYLGDNLSDEIFTQKFSNIKTPQQCLLAFRYFSGNNKIKKDLYPVVLRLAGHKDVISLTWLYHSYSTRHQIAKSKIMQSFAQKASSIEEALVLLESLFGDDEKQLNKYIRLFVKKFNAVEDRVELAKFCDHRLKSEGAAEMIMTDVLQDCKTTADFLEVSIFFIARFDYKNADRYFQKANLNVKTAKDENDLKRFKRLFSKQ